MRQQPLDQDLAALLADYQVLYMKLRGYHWTVTGPLFFGLHAKFEELYDEAAEKVDALAERLAARGARPPVTLREQLALARLKEDAGQPSANDMVRNVATDLETLNVSLRALEQAATRAGDAATQNLVQGYADGQEKTIWMLRAFLHG
ncbi:MAG: DNA starvation/stationary phase protection protein [Planctomycetes bacterium]|nr:DNA starvation/stationary phase protection protein [Planctomycetota bacterium]